MATKKLPDTIMTLHNTYCNTAGSFLISSALPAACLEFNILATINATKGLPTILKETPKGSAIYGTYATEEGNKRKYACKYTANQSDANFFLLEAMMC